MQHVTRCQTRLETFATIDDEVTRHTVAALRDNGRAELPDDLRQRQAERDIAKADLQAAERALAVLAAALADARDDAETATTAARKAAAGVLAIEAEALAERHEALIAEAAEIRQRLAQFDRAVTGSGAMIPPAVLRDPRHAVNLMRAIYAGEWRAKLDALLDGASAAED